MSPPNFRNEPAALPIENIQSSLQAHNPIRELQRGHGPEEVIDNVFQDVLDQTFGRSGADRDFWRKPPSIQDDFEIDFSTDRQSYARRREPVDLLRTSQELMSTLDKYSGIINVEKHSDRITKNELRHFIQRAGNLLSPQEKADLMLIEANFKQIAGVDGRKDISYRDMAYFVMANRDSDREIRANRYLERNTRYDDWGWMKPTENQREQSHTNQEVQKPSRIITSPNAPADHFRVEGANLPLSQEEFKAHYGIPDEIDLTKFMRTKPNDGEVPNFWTSKVAAGLGGRDDKNDLRWNNPNYHEPSLDFQRNFAQLSQYFDKLPPDQQVEFAFNFARTQGEVLRMHGVQLLAVDNEKIQIHEEGSTKYVDFVQDVGSVRHLLQWGVEA